MIVVSFYTVNTPYQTEILNLRRSLAKLHMVSHMKPIASQGNWAYNCSMKPEIILEAMDTYEDDILYLDADAEVLSYPKYFETMPGDIGMHYKDGRELLNGTMFIRNNPESRRIIEKWAEVQADNLDQMDNHVLQDVIKKYAKELGCTITDIPAQYCQIFDLMANCGEPVIRHNQASRRFKRLIR